MAQAVVTAPITTREWGVLVDAGVLADQRVELLNGRKVAISPENLPHGSSISSTHACGCTATRALAVTAT